MRRLYFKILLWFWLGVVIVSVTLVSLTALTYSRAQDDARWEQKYGPRVDLWARQEVHILRLYGPQSLEKYVGSFQYDPGVLNYIFDANNKDVLGREASSAVMRVVASMGQEPRQKIAASDRIIAQNIADAKGSRYTVVVDFPEPSIIGQPLFAFLFENPDDLTIDTAAVIRVVAVFIVAGLFCFWLARQIVSPIDRLRLATRALANERLEVRVDKTVLARRDELADLGHDFDRMAERMETLVTAERRLLADVSHALRSPLARLNVALGLARRQTPPDTMSEHLERIERETERVNQLIDRLLTMARIDSGVDVERTARFQLGALVDEIAADADYEARSRDCTVTVDTRGDYMVHAARELVRGAIENVVRNAVYHTADRTTVEIRMSTKRLPHGSVAVIEVRDHGWGVLGDAIERLFIPFHRVVDPRSPSSDGTGLGLAITKRTFELFGGSVSATNAAGGGLVVTMELPLVEADRHAVV